MIIDIPQLSGGESVEELVEHMAKLQKLVQFIVNGKISDDNVRAITASKLTAGEIDTGDITIGADESGKFYRIDGDGIVANNGSVNTLLFDLATGLLTVTSALIQSAMGYPKVVLNSGSDLIAAYADADTYLSIQPVGTGSVPSLGLIDAGTTKGFLNRAAGGTTLGTFDGESLTFQASGNLNLSPTGNLQIGGVNGSSGTFFVSPASGAPASIPITFTKGLKT